LRQPSWTIGHEQLQNREKIMYLVMVLKVRFKTDNFQQKRYHRSYHIPQRNVDAASPMVDNWTPDGL